MSSGREYGLLFVLPAIIVLALLVVYPLAYTGLLSVTDDQGHYVGAANYAAVIGARVTTTAVWNIHAQVVAATMPGMTQGMTVSERTRARPRKRWLRRTPASVPSTICSTIETPT